MFPCISMFNSSSVSMTSRLSGIFCNKDPYRSCHFRLFSFSGYTSLFTTSFIVPERIDSFFTMFNFFPSISGRLLWWSLAIIICAPTVEDVSRPFILDSRGSGDILCSRAVPFFLLIFCNDGFPLEEALFNKLSKHPVFSAPKKKNSFRFFFNLKPLFLPLW